MPRNDCFENISRSCLCESGDLATSVGGAASEPLSVLRNELPLLDAVSLSPDGELKLPNWGGNKEH